MSQTLTFINEGVLKRLEVGSFVPTRKSQSPASGQERRNTLSPLAVTKRCIRYEPLVFSNRRATILQLAHALNDAERKIFLVGGAQGMGKTSLVRGLIELMGSQSEKPRLQDSQLLWFDANRHTDFEEIIQFLIQGITEICDAQSISPFNPELNKDYRMDRSRPGTPTSEDPLKRLETSLQEVAEMPLLLVLDNVEFIVDANLRLNSHPFKELLNFLLAKPNIKMILLGERLPYADMSPNQEGILDIQLEGLSEADTLAFWQRRGSSSPKDPAILEDGLATDETDSLKHLYRKTRGAPWLLKALESFHHHANLSFKTLNRLLPDDVDLNATLVQLAYERLPDQHRRLFQTLSFLRHPMNARGLLALMSVCFPLLDASRPDENTMTDLLEHSLIRPFLKINFPPQQVLNHIRNRNQASGKYQPWFELYLSAKQALYQSIPASEQTRIHDALQDFYLKDKSNEAEQRVLRIKNRAMLAEAKYHGSLARHRVDMSNKADAGASMSSKAYVYQQARPLTGSPARLTLDDYRQIQIPEEPELELPEEATEPVYIENASISLPPASFTDILASLENSSDPEARGFLQEAREYHLQQSFKEEIKPEPSKPEPEPADLQGFTQHLLLETHADTEERIIQQRLAAAVAAHDSKRLSRELLALAQYRASHGRFEEALHCLDKALQLKPESMLLAEIYQLYGSIHKATYHHNAAVAALSKAIAYLEPLMLLDITEPSLGKNLGKTYQDLSDIQIYRKHYLEAAESLQQAIRWYQHAKDDGVLGELYFQLAGVFESLQQPQDAITYYEGAIAVDSQHGNLPAVAATLANLGNLYQANGQNEQAVQCLKQSLECDRQLNEFEGQMSTLESLAQIYQEQENLHLAEQAIRQGLSLAIQEQSQFWQSRFYTLLGQWASQQSDWAQALQHYERAYSSGKKELSTESLNWLQEMITGLKTLLKR